MLAETVHSLADTANQLLLLLGASRARRKPTPEHPFGYGRERYFWSFVVALVLFSLGSLFAMAEGISKLRDPHPIASAGWAIGVLLVAMGLESWSFRTALVEAQRVRGGLGWWAFIRRCKSPELPVVLLEDLGALLGLSFALCAIALSITLDEPIFDAVGTIAIGVLLGGIAVVLAVEMKSLLIGEAALPGDTAKIAEAIEASPQVRRLIHLKTLHLGPEELLVAAKIELDGELSLSEATAAIDLIEERVRGRVATARVIYLEPDVFRGESGAS
jgi:cation diffusion facilitator family transporter